MIDARQPPPAKRPKLADVIDMLHMVIQDARADVQSAELRLCELHMQLAHVKANILLVEAEITEKTAELKHVNRILHVAQSPLIGTEDK